MHNLKASATLYLQEELSDARLRCDELKGYIVQALDLINASGKKDHFYAVAGELINGIPNALLKLERALQASAMTVDRLDSEEIKSILRPEKVEELERMLEEVRIKIPRRTGIDIPVNNDYDYEV